MKSFVCKKNELIYRFQILKLNYEKLSPNTAFLQ